MSISIQNDQVLITVGGQVISLTPDAAREIGNQLHDAAQEIETAAIVAENEAFENRPIPEGVTLISSREQSDKVAEAIQADGKESHVFFSASYAYRYKGGEDGDTLMVESVLDQIAVEGRVQFKAEGYDPDEETYGDYESPILENPTWMEVAKVCNDMILRTGDFHHCFLESVVEKGETEDEGGSVKVCHFVMGS